MRLIFCRTALPLLVGVFGCVAGSTNGPTTRPVAYAMVAHPRTGVELPRIRLPERPAVEQKVNDALDSLGATFTCEGIALDGENAWYDTTASVSYAAGDVLSVRVTSSYYCGGAYPSGGVDSSQTFDLRTGGTVGFRALFRDAARDGAEIARAYLENLPAGEGEDCEDVLTVEELDGHFFSYTIAREGLRLAPQFPHVIAACNIHALIPFARVRALAPADGILVGLP